MIRREFFDGRKGIKKTSTFYERVKIKAKIKINFNKE